MTRKRFGVTWWGRRWISALAALGAVYENRLPRGRTYARHGAVVDLEVVPGRVTAKVQGRRRSPYRVTIRLPVFEEGAWRAVSEALAQRVGHAAPLLEGRMPEDVDEVLRGCGVSLFPGPGELETTCSCPDYANPCKHVAAVHYVLAETFDADPFLLPTLRGRDREALLAGLRAARAGTHPADPIETPERGPMPLQALEARGLFRAQGDLGAVAVRPGPPAGPLALRTLGPPPGVPASTRWRLEELVTGATETAWRLLHAFEEDDPVLALLADRARLSSREVAGALGTGIDQARSLLREHIKAGRVRRTGHGRATRYELIA